MSTLQAIRIEGGIVPPALFQHIQSGAIGDAASRSAASYHLPGRETIRDAANRSWTYLTGAWQAWREAQGREPGGTASTNAALVRERWLLVLLQELGYGRLPARSGGIDVDEQHYPVSHVWQHVPIHLLGPGVDLDRRNPGVAGATRAPQAMVQELLNRTDDHLWAVLSNGLRLRLLRDSTALAGSAFIEFDLEAIFDGELFAEFLLLWQMCHQSRLEAREADSGEPSITECWLELWRADSVKAGARALDRLRSGVEDALTHLGTGFLAHPANTDLRAALHSGALRPEDYHRHLLRLVYRLLFLFVTEDRDVLLDPGADATARARYTDFLSTQRVRAQARQRQGSASYADLWQAQRLVLRALGGDGRPELALPALGGLFDPEESGAEPLLDAELANDAFLAAIRDLAWLRTGQRLQPVDYRNLGAEELGSVYEALLELVPRVSVEDHRFTLEHLRGNERKTTGSYYTPPGLVSALLDTALDPVLDDTVAGAGTSQEAEDRLLALKVVDPACGSGHFIVAAARRIAQRVAAVRSGEDESTPAEVRHALRDVVGRCVYGVDLNPLAAELAKVSLWLEAAEPGKALGFLDARIRVGNSLLGTTPALLAAGVPDEAFKPLEGDDKRIATAVRKRNAAERGAHGHVQDSLDLDFTPPAVHTLAEERQALLQPQDDAEAVRAQARRWRDYEQSADYRDRKAHADAWTAAFVWPLSSGAARAVESKTSYALQAPTSAIVRRLRSEPQAVTLAPIRAGVAHLANEYRFFHWHLEFPEVFGGPASASAEGWSGGFDAVMGNPPFLNQLESATSVHPGVASFIRIRFPGMVGAYTDVSAVILALGIQVTRQGGRLGMVQPQSILAARDAGGVRSFAMQRGSMRALWFSSKPVFEANVITCAVTIEVGAEQGRVERYEGPSYRRIQDASEGPDPDGTWSSLLTESLGVPAVTATASDSIRKFASATADFRDQYYGLAPYVLEAQEGEFPSSTRAALITTGLVDPAVCYWGQLPTRFNKRKFDRPLVHLDALRHGAPKLAQWAADRLVPKILLATQGKVIEAVVDERGAWLPSVPIITVIPTEGYLWLVAAALLAPPVSAYAARQFAGAGLTAEAIKLSARQVLDLPLPPDIDSLERAARLVERAHRSYGSARRELLIQAGEASNEAYGADEGVFHWWAARLPDRARSGKLSDRVSRPVVSRGTTRESSNDARA